MIGKAITMSLLAAMLASCAVETVDEAEVGDTQQALEGGLYIWACTGADAWTRIWKVNGIEKGREYCECDGTIQQFGTIGGQYTQVSNYSCSGGGGGGGGGGGECPSAAALSLAKLVPFYPPPICD